MIEKRIQKLNQKIGEGIYLSALQDFASGRTSRERPGALLWGLSALVVASPYVFAALGVLLLFVDFPNLLTLVFGGAFLGLGWMLRPRKPQLPVGAVGRDSLPETFALLDAISAQLDTPKVSKVVLDNQFNAYAAEVRNTPIVGIGALLWLASDRPQRLAVLGHELGHLAHRDTRRIALPDRALMVLNAWQKLLDMDYYVDAHTGVLERESNGIFADLFSAALRGIVDTLTWAILKLSFAESQKAEYLADASGLRVAGRQASLAALDLLVRIDASGALRSGILPRQGEAGFDFLSRLAGTVDQLPPDQAARALAAHSAEKLSLDTTHPPAAYRQAFIKGLPEALLEPPLEIANWAAIEVELKTHFEKIGRREIAAFEVQ